MHILASGGRYAGGSLRQSSRGLRPPLRGANTPAARVALRATDAGAVFNALVCTYTFLSESCEKVHQVNGWTKC